MPLIFDPNDRQAQEEFREIYNGAFQAIGELLASIVAQAKDDHDKIRRGFAVAAACSVVKELTILKASPELKADFEAGLKVIMRQSLAELKDIELERKSQRGEDA